jgi:acetyl/propionyl-CoA carboxylase alpha subunit
MFFLVAILSIALFIGGCGDTGVIEPKKSEQQSSLETDVEKEREKAEITSLKKGINKLEKEKKEIEDEIVSNKEKREKLEIQLKEERKELEKSRRTLRQVEFNLRKVKSEQRDIERKLKNRDYRISKAKEMIESAKKRVKEENIGACSIGAGMVKSEVEKILGTPKGDNFDGKFFNRFSTEWFYGDKIIEFNHGGVVLSVGLCD